MDLMRVKENIENDNIIYHPLGSEKISSQRIFFSAIVQIILLFWYGAESLYHPQLIDDFYLYFISFFIFFYTFGFYWILLDCWKYSKIEIILDKEQAERSIINSNNFDGVISFLKMKSFKIISIINLLVFIILNLVNLILAILIVNNNITGFKYNLPGTGLENSEPIILSYIIYGILIIHPVTLGLLLSQVYKDINELDKNKLDKLLNTLPKATQEQILRNIKQLNENYRNKLRLE
jgi:hypothetical protein